MATPYAGLLATIPFLFLLIRMSYLKIKRRYPFPTGYKFLVAYKSSLQWDFSLSLCSYLLLVFSARPLPLAWVTLDGLRSFHCHFYKPFPTSLGEMPLLITLKIPCIYLYLSISSLVDIHLFMSAISLDSEQHKKIYFIL